tara:strand:- start:56084 stop:56590 length:507 start_codon:yes stop_codon:yes gene_type:complete
MRIETLIRTLGLAAFAAGFGCVGFGVGFGCVASPDYSATRFACSEGVCPAGYDCIEGVCIAPGLEPDAAVVVDAATPDASVPDALPAATCDEMFSGAPGYELCSEDEASCSFNVLLEGTACTSACELLGTTCLGAFENEAIACDPIPDTGATCATVRNSNICVCARIP